MKTIPASSTDRCCLPRGFFFRVRWLLSILLVAAFALPAQGRQDQSDLSSLGLEDEFFTAEALGVRMNPPIGALIQVQRGQDSVAVTMMDGTDLPAWSLRIQEFQSSLANPSSARQIDALLQSWRNADREFRTLSSRSVDYGGRPGHLCFILAEADSGEAMVAGWLMVQKEAQSFLVFAMQLHAGEFDRLEDLMTASFSTLRIFAPREIAGSRKARLKRGGEILATITPERLRSLGTQDQWYRLYLPSAASGGASDQELGYYRVRMRGGLLGEIEPTRDPVSYTAAEKVSGFLVTVLGHYLSADPADGAGGGSPTTYDSEANYWVAWDQSQEAWSIRGTHRQGSRSISEAQTGVRPPLTAGEPRATLTVISSQRDGATRDQQAWQVPEVYLAQATRWVLARFLPRDSREQIMFSAYCFDPTAPQLALSLRIDEWEPVLSGFGAWKMSSRTRSDALRVVSIHDSRGVLLRRDWADGRVTEPIELDQLHRLWRSKGLDTGPMKK